MIIDSNGSLLENSQIAQAVSLEDLLASGPEAIQARSVEFGLSLRLANTVDVRVLPPYFPLLKTIELEFPAFGDGRAYSQGLLLRHLGFTGLLLARGAAVVADQLLGMKRVGFDLFELRADQSSDFCGKLLSQAESAYQASFLPKNLPYQVRQMSV